MGGNCSHCKRDQAHAPHQVVLHVPPSVDPGGEQADAVDLIPMPSQQPDAWTRLGGKQLEEPLQRDWLRLVRAAWLVDLAESGGVLRRRQDLPSEAFIGLQELQALGPGGYVLGTCLRVIVLSYPWLQPGHPDPHGENLRVIAKALKLYVEHQENGLQPYGVLIDFAALPQAPRTAEEDAVFELGLSALNLFYSHPNTVVLKVTTFPQGYPNSSGYAYDLPNGTKTVAAYCERGWCFAESAMSGLVKSSDKILDLSKLPGDASLLEAIVASKSPREPPLHPDDFKRELNTKIFGRKKADFDKVAELYSEAFREHLESARELDCSGLMWDTDAVRQLLQALRSNHFLEVLHLGDNRIGLKGVVALGELLRRSECLQVLELPNSHIGPGSMVALGEALQSNRSLQSLNLYRNEIGLKGVTALGDALQGKCFLQELNLHHAHTGSEGAEVLGAALSSNASLRTLGLNFNDIGPKGASALGEGLCGNTSLRSLELHCNSVGPKGALALGEALQSNTSLQLLRVGENEIGPEGAAPLAEALRSNASLQRLDLHGNDIGPAGTFMLQEALESNSTLKELDLRDNLLTAEAIATLRKAAHARMRF